MAISAKAHGVALVLAVWAFVLAAPPRLTATEAEELSAGSYGEFLILTEQPALPAATAPSSAVPILNFGSISDGVFRGEYLNEEEDYRFLSEELGIATVVDLRYFHQDDPKLCARYRLNCVDFGLLLFPAQDRVFDWDIFREAFHFVAEERQAGRKTYIHCRYGSDRTGALASALIIRDRACSAGGGAVDKDALWSLIDGTLSQYGFHHIYGGLHTTIRSWVYDFENNPWLCQ